MNDLEQRVLLIMATGTMGNNEKARAIISIVLEEAAKVAESKTQYRGRTIIAAAIRAIGAP